MSAVSAQLRRQDAPRPLDDRPRFVPEIQGLRTLALLLVVTFHIWFGRVSGGVDIFLLVSAYLLTRSLLAGTGAPCGATWRSALDTTLRRFARLLPAAATVIAATLAAALLLLPSRYWAAMLEQALAAATYTMNFWLQSNAIDYYAQSRADASLFQHFWSLSIQGQVFVLWPLLHIAAVRLARLLRLPPRPVLIAVFGALTAGSFAYSVHATAADQTLAYFDTAARLWEFGAGSLLALLVHRLSAPSWLRHAMTWTGIAGAVSLGFVLPVESSFPGWAALWPVASACLIIAAADAPRRRPYGGNRLLGSGLLRWAGTYSYALYLTHWPVLVLFSVSTGIARPGIRHGALILLIAVLAAFLVAEAVERPVARWLSAERGRRAQPRRSAALLRRCVVAAACAALAITSIGLGEARLRTETTRAMEDLAGLDLRLLGPQADPDQTFDRVIPDEVIGYSARADPPVESSECPLDSPYTAGVCTIIGDPATASREVLVVGSSHAAMFGDMLLETVSLHPDWTLRAQAAPGCMFTEALDPESQCGATWAAASAYIRDYTPDLLVVVGTMSVPDGPDQLFDGSVYEDFGVVMGDLPALLDELTSDTKTQAVVIRDVPRRDDSIYECGLALGFANLECAWPAPENTPELAAFITDLEAAGHIWVDFNEALCPGGVCGPSQGGIVTYYDHSHLTAVYSRALAQAFADQLGERVPWWPDTPWQQ